MPIKVEGSQFLYVPLTVDGLFLQWLASIRDEEAIKLGIPVLRGQMEAAKKQELWTETKTLPKLWKATTYINRKKYRCYKFNTLGIQIIRY